ncbi:DUF5011 domain-containing protein [Vibrio sp. SM6]|uniref:DUF5011 domain-containing protein n=1 Tax=Vibrio agarilyticus TaxID=2726741 RepID=A0A7X8TSN2_9VIBR|nr:immunoglobulin-like domain-containing protein [Vibrio agarilyticus]NLS14059.1 DUF5011 domain-containing protein [Vibrio agarilyticus]
MVLGKNTLTCVALLTASALAITGCDSDSESATSQDRLPPQDNGTSNAALSIFDDHINEQWAPFHSENSALAKLVTDPDNISRDALQYTLNKNSDAISGFTARNNEDGHNATNGAPFDAEQYVETGVVEFDLKLLDISELKSAIWLVQLEDVNGNRSELRFQPNSHDDWQHWSFALSDFAHAADANFDMSQLELFLIYPDHPAAKDRAFLIDNMAVYAADTGPDTEPPMIVLNGAETILHTLNTEFIDPGVIVSDNVDQNMTVLVGGDAVDITKVGSYRITYNATDKAGNKANEVIRYVEVIAEDRTPPKLELRGEPTVVINLHDDYVEQGATAVDNVDGDLTTSIEIDSRSVDIAKIGKYSVYYTVEDMAGNQAQLVREVRVVDPNANAIIANGDFELPLTDAWQVDAGQAQLTIVDGELVIDEYRAGSDPWVPSVTYSKIQLTPNMPYALSFDARADTSRKIVAQLGKNLGEAPWYSSVMRDQTVELDTEMHSFRFVFTATDAASEPLDLVYAIGAGPETPITLDNVSLTPVTAEQVPPVIELHGDLEMTMMSDTAFIEPGYTAFDNIDGDVTDEVLVTHNINESVAGEYVVNYDVSDSDGNAATRLKRYVEVLERPKTNLIFNGDFSAPSMAPWVGDGGEGNLEYADGVMKTRAPNSKTVLFKQINVAQGYLKPGQPLDISFSMKGEVTPNGVVTAFVQTANSTSGVTKTEYLPLPAMPPQEWTDYKYTITVGDNPEWGISIHLGATCGAEPGCEATAYFDNVMVTEQ